MVAALMIVTEAVSSYLDDLRAPPDAVLEEMEAHAARDRIPIVVPQTGALLHVLALAAGARRVVEVGTAIGVSTLHLARAVGEGGSVISFEIDDQRHEAAVRYLERAGVSERVDLRLQDAREGLTELEPGSFDFAFVDGVKAQYGDYLELVLPLLRPGGVLTVDNVLMSGTVAENRSDGSWSEAQIEGMRDLNKRLLGRLTGLVTPVGDGVLVAVRT
jgi:predicted O-methyltransferase YrrM